jgi:hypothetical protein
LAPTNRFQFGRCTSSKILPAPATPTLNGFIAPHYPTSVMLAGAHEPPAHLFLPRRTVHLPV